MNGDAVIRKEMIIGKFRSKLTFIFGTGDLEDVESIIDFYEQKIKHLEEKEELHLNRIDELTDRVVELETNINNVSKCLEENRKQYIYQDGLGEDWYFEDLDVYSELQEILDKVGVSNE